MSRSYYGEETPDYYQQEQYGRQQRGQAGDDRPQQSRIPRLAPLDPQRRRGEQQGGRMRPEQQNIAPGRSPRRAQEQYYPEHQSAWDASQNLYDGSGYEEDYGQYEQQWPLPTQPYAQQPRHHGSPRRAPPRPQRPDESPQRQYQQPVRDRSGSNVPASHQQYGPPSGSHHGNGQWTGEGYSYPPPSHPPPRRPPPQGPMTAIPQYVEPQMPQQVAYGQANRRAPLGPPPSARRGPASYYPQVGPVHPIVEETDSMRSSNRAASSIHTGGHDSKTSFASSNAIPIGIPQVYLDDRRPGTREHLPTPEEYESDDASVQAATGRRLDRFAQAPPSRDQPSPEAIVRKASLGKKSRPTLTTVKSTDKIRKASAEGIASLPSQQHSRQQSKEVQPTASETERSRAIAQEQLEGHTLAGAEDSVTEPSTTMVEDIDVNSRPVASRSESRTPEDILKSGTGLLDPSSSESENEVKRKRSKELLGAAIANELHPQRSRARSPLAPDNEERINSILMSLEKGGAISAAEAEELKKPMAGLSERPGKRRPPRLDVDAVRSAEARGSLTSLPDLIKRATKLASNLDRGKTASRLGMNWLEGATDEKRKSGNSLSDMLSAFPPPIATPTGSRNEMRRSLTNWSSRLRHSALPSNSDAGEFKKRGRRCCGMPLWLFVLLMLLLFLLVAAAVVVPVILLVVVPGNDNNHQMSDIDSCRQKLNCENGGANILSSSGTCQCLCVNGYTGTTCTTYQQQGCTSTSIGSTTNATVGNAIPRLISGASNYSVPLDGQSLLGLFSAADMNCAGQNALVTFNGASSKRDIIDVRVPAPTPVKRQESTAGTAATSEGIVFASGSTPTASATTSSATTTSTSVAGSNNSTLDFARVAVLYVFQASGQLDSAATAQNRLQEYFRTGRSSSDAQNISLGNGYACDLTGFTVTLSNGTSV